MAYFDIQPSMGANCPEGNLSFNRCNMYPVAQGIPDIKFTGQVILPNFQKSGCHNTMPGFPFGIPRSSVAPDLHLYIDAHKRGLKLSHALSLALQKDFKKIIGPIC